MLAKNSGNVFFMDTTQSGLVISALGQLMGQFCATNRSVVVSYFPTVYCVSAREPRWVDGCEKDELKTHLAGSDIRLLQHRQLQQQHTAPAGCWAWWCRTLACTDDACLTVQPTATVNHVELAHCNRDRDR